MNRIAPTNTHGLICLAKLKLRTDQPEVALAYFNAALKHADGPLLKSALIAKANLLQRLNRQEESIDLYKGWNKKMPEDETAKHMLAAVSDTPPPDKPGEQYVKDLFDRFAFSFDSALEGLDYKAPVLIESVIKSKYTDTLKNQCILDAGCGTGLCAHFLRPIASNLVGVDLSSGMLNQALVLGYYDELVEEDLVSFLERKDSEYNLIISADTLCYFGRLLEFFAAAHNALQSNSELVFTVEREYNHCSTGFKLNSHGRYSHTREYIEGSLKKNHFSITSIIDCHLRTERGVPVEGMLVTATAD